MSVGKKGRMGYQAKENITKITSEPTQCKTSYGNWVVKANTHFNNGVKEWDYPSKSFYFWTKKRALGFIEQVNHEVNNGRLITT